MRIQWMILENCQKNNMSFLENGKEFSIFSKFIEKLEFFFFSKFPENSIFLIFFLSFPKN